MSRRIKYSKKLGEFIADKLESGMTLNDICRQYSEKVPVARTIYRWRRDNPEFRQLYDTARETQLYIWSDNMHDLTRKTTDELIAELQEKNPDWDERMLKVALNDTRRSIDQRKDAIKFDLAKGIAQMTKRVELDHKGVVVDSGPQIVIQSYALPEDLKPLETSKSIPSVKLDS